MGPASCAQHHTKPVSTINMAPRCSKDCVLPLLQAPQKANQLCS